MEESRDWLASGMQMIWLCVVSRTFFEVCRRRGLKVNSGKRKIILLGGGGRIRVLGLCKQIRLQHFSEFKYMGYVLDELGSDKAEYRRKVESGRRVAGASRSMVNARSL